MIGLTPNGASSKLKTGVGRHTRNGIVRFLLLNKGYLFTIETLVFGG